jgi:plastocyanin
VTAGAILIALAGTFEPARGDAAPAATSSGAAASVVIEALQFTPRSLSVRVGQPVTWRNKDPFPHTVTAAGFFDSKTIPPGGSWTFTPRKAGDYAYQCTLHPTMMGKLTVR